MFYLSLESALTYVRSILDISVINRWHRERRGGAGHIVETKGKESLDLSKHAYQGSFVCGYRLANGKAQFELSIGLCPLWLEEQFLNRAIMGSSDVSIHPDTDYAEVSKSRWFAAFGDIKGKMMCHSMVGLGVVIPIGCSAQKWCPFIGGSVHLNYVRPIYVSNIKNIGIQQSGAKDMFFVRPSLKGQLGVELLLSQCWRMKWFYACSWMPSVTLDSVKAEHRFHEVTQTPVFKTVTHHLGIGITCDVGE